MKIVTKRTIATSPNQFALHLVCGVGMTFSPPTNNIGAADFPVSKQYFSGIFSASTWYFSRFRYFSSFRIIFLISAKIFLASAKHIFLASEKIFRASRRNFYRATKYSSRFRYFLASKKYFSRYKGAFFSLRRGV